MRGNLTKNVGSAIFSLILITAFSTPLIVVPLTTDSFDTPKVLFLAAVTLLAIVLWAFSWVLDGKVTFRKTPFDLPLLLLLVIIVLSTIFSYSRYSSIYGLPRIHGSAISWFAYILFYFVAVSHVKTKAQVKSLVSIFLASSTIIALVSLLSYFNIYLPFAFAKVVNFTTTGSSFSASAILVLTLPLLLTSFVSQNRLLPTPLTLILTLLFGVVISLIGTPATQLAALVILVLLIYLSRKDKLLKHINFLIVPLILSLLFFGLGLVPGKSNVFNKKHVDFPKEIQLPFATSWKISASAFRDAPFLGSGPATYISDFTAYKPIELNTGKFWNIRFDSSFNEYLQTWTTLGTLGLLSLVFLTLAIVSFAWKGLVSSEEENSSLRLALSLSALSIIILLALHASTPTVVIASLLILAALVSVNKLAGGNVEELTIGIKTSKLTDSSLIVGDILPIILFVPILGLGLFGAWNGYKVALADYYHRLALNSAATKGIEVYNFLIKAEQLNPYVDIYRTDLAQTNFALANAIATQKGPTEASQGGSLTDQDKQNISQLLQQSIAEGRAAVTISPRSVQNWEVLASIYRQISGVAQNALQFSLDSYGRAIQLDPLNPNLRLAVGGVYYQLKNYDLAIRFFDDAVSLKPDFTNGLYNLAIALRDKGAYKEGVVVAEKLVALLSKDTSSKDYLIAADLLKELKAKTPSLPAGGLQPTTATPSASLENKNLPKVLNLPQPEEIATPPAVKK